MIVEIKTFFSHLLPMLPILGAGVVDQREGGDITKLSTAGVISRLLELAILGGIFLYTTVQVMNSKIEVIEKFMDKHEAQCVQSREKINEIQTALTVLNFQHSQEQQRDALLGNTRNILDK